jgi:tetratricopeptide (TPR) repeat protein
VSDRQNGLQSMLKSILVSATLYFSLFGFAFAASAEYGNCVLSDKSSTKSPDDTISICTAAIESKILSDTEIAKAKAARAAAYKRIGNYNDAVHDYEDAIALDKANPDLLFEAGNLYAAIRDTDNALKAYDKAIELMSLSG